MSDGTSGDGRSKRRRRVYACDSCYKKKIKCDGMLPKCDWCHHHNIPCVYTRNQEPPRSLSRNTLKQKHRSIPASDASTPVEQNKDALPRSPYPTPGPQAVAPQGFGANIFFAGQSLGSIGGFNGLPVFSPGGIEWIKARTGQEVSLDWYQTVSIKATGDLGDGGHSLQLPDIRLLRQLLEKYKTSFSYRLFPVLNLACFEYTIRTAYGNEFSDISPGSISAKACIFAFMALTAFLTGGSQGDAMMHTDRFAREASRLMPQMLSESVTLDGLQAILMLCFCCQAVSSDILRLELLLSSAARFIFHLKGHIYPVFTERDPLHAKLHVRNLFWIGFILDKFLSLRTGLQPLFDVLTCDLTLPDNVRILDYDLTAFHTIIRLSLVKSDIYRELYSLSALRKGDADLLATIRTLDSDLEEWWSSVPRLSTDPNDESILADFLFENQYYYSIASIHQASSRCTAWALNQDTRAAGSSLAISVSAGRSVLNKFLHAKPHLLGHHLMFCLPELTLATIHLFSNILMNPLDPLSGKDLDLMRKALSHVGKHIWQQAPESFTAQVRLVERFMADLQRLAEHAIRKAENG